MPTNLTGNSIASTYGQLLHVDGGATSTQKTVVDGDGTATALKVATTSAAVAGELTIEGANALKLADADSSHSVGIKAPATVTSNVTLTLPATAGSTGQVLSTDGTGVLAWSNVDAGFTNVLDTQTFNTSGTWTKPSVGRMAVVRIWGGGGSGGKGNGTNFLGGGGGGGAFVEKFYNLADLPSTVSVTIGAGGASQTAGASGNSGGSTTFGALLTAYGGGGGGRGTSSTVYGGGGGGGGSDSAGGTGGASSSSSSASGTRGAGSREYVNAIVYVSAVNQFAAPPTISGQIPVFQRFAVKNGGTGARGGYFSSCGEVRPDNVTSAANDFLGIYFDDNPYDRYGFYGGGGGSASVPLPGVSGGSTFDALGGNSLWGGAGGGGALQTLGGGKGGTSTFGGNGGTGGADAIAGGNGVQPGGGGGGSETGNSGAGGAGRCVVYVI